MKKILKTIMILIIGLMYFIPSIHAYGEEVHKKVLLLYDSMAVSTEYEGNIEELKRLLPHFGYDVIVDTYQHIDTNHMKYYNYIITVTNEEDSTYMNQSLIEEIANHAN